MTRAWLLGPLLAFSFSMAAHAHQAPSGWAYDAWCCSNQDCAQIPASAVRTTPEGYVVTLGKGDHPQKTKASTFTIPYSEAKPSPDGEYHICLWPNEFKANCFYAGSKDF